MVGTMKANLRLQGKSAVIYGANSPAGAAVARAIAKEGATVYLAGRSTSRLQPVAREILNAGGAVEVAKVDPMDPKAVTEHLHQVVVKHGTVDVSLNLAFLGVVGSTRLCNLTDEQFASATFTRVRSNFVTAAAAAREMSYQGRGTILATGVPDGVASDGGQAAPAIGSAAIEALCRQLRADVGSFGVNIDYLPGLPAGEVDRAEAVIRALTPSSPAPSQEAAGAELSASGRRGEVPTGEATG
jgi:3-oxoacyl-[acyl-carrier protein] reductase